MVSPLRVIEARPTPEANAGAVLAVAAEYEVDAIVIGLPLNMDGTEGPQAKLSQAMAETIRNVAEASATSQPAARVAW